MFTLIQLAYYACTEDEKKWYSDKAYNMVDVDWRQCCETLIRGINTGDDLFLWDLNVCPTAAAHGHLVCLQVAHRLGLTMARDTCAQAVANGHTECFTFAVDHGCPWN